MKILLTMNLPYLPIYGGANKINRTIAEGLAARGHTVEVVVPALGVPSRVTHAEFIAEVKAEGIEVVSDGKVDSFHLRGVTVHAVREPTQLRTSLIERVERFQPERVLLSSEDPSHNLLDALLKVCAERVVYLVHTVSFLPFGPQAFFPSAGRAKLIEQVGGIVAISNYVARYIEQWSGLQSDVIYWPCYGSAPFPRLGSFDGEFVTMVNPCAIKGISIFEALAQWLPEVKFAGVLTWGAVEEDRRALESLPNVELLEPTTDIERIFSRTRVLLVPSLWEESFGLTVVEALLRGIPVLASDIGGLPEAKLGTDFLLPVRPIERFTERLNENMLPLPIVPKQDIAPWRDALRRLLSEREFYERQSEISRDAAAKFVASLSLDPLEHLLNRRATKPPSAHQHVAPATPKANDAQPSQPNDSSHPAEQLPVGLDDLTPEQQSLLMLLLREKAAKQTDEQAPQSQQTQTIQPMPRDGKAPLSFAQQRLWFLDQFEPNSATYNIPAAVRLSGTLDVAALEQSFDETLRRHEILRTNFALIDDQPTQLIAATRKQSLPIIDLQSLPADQQEGEVRNYAQRQAQQPFDLTSDPLLRSVLLRLSPTEHVLLVTMHHIISDAWSMSILIREITQLYEAYARGQTSPLAPLTIQYADYAAWQRMNLTDKRLEAELAYWKEQLKDAPPLLELPTDRPRPAVQSYRGASVELKIGKELTDEIREKSQEQGATLFMTLLAAFQVLLSKYSGADDVSVGTAIAGRNRAEVEGLIGFFVNTLVLRTRLDGNPDFRELLERVREMTLGAYAHQDVPFEKLVEELAPKREMSHAPLFQVMFTLQNAPRESLQLPGLTLAQVEVETGAAMFDLSLSIEETAQGLFGVWEYNADLFDAATVRRIAGHFQTLLENIVARPQQRVSELSLMEEAERVRLLWEWNETGEEFPLDKCLHELFEEQAARTPDASALIFEDERLTYRELNTRANRLAQHLISLGVGAEVSVGICMERSLEMVIALFAIMKAGGAYVPLEPDYPRERLSYMLKDADVRVLLTEQKFAGRLPEHAAQIVDIDAERDVISRQSERNPSSGVVAANLIYIIYTSGSTGRPKGVMVPHRGVCNCLLWMQQRHRLTETDRVLFKAPLGFDASVWELFWPLLLGAGVVVARAGEQRDSAYLVELIARQRVTTVHFVPSMFQVFLEEKGLESCDALTRVICGGEALPLATAERFYQRLNGELHNFYGPTETSIGSIDWTCHPNIKHRTVPIGRPIANTECYLLDANLQPVPLGVSGELYTGGVGVARGYLGLPALTAEKFIPHPFSREPGARLYKSGDMARRLSDGNIEFLGRVDHQVKLRGLRIELGEIETALGRHPSVRDVVVVVREDVPGDKRLVAYLVWQRGAAAMSNSEMRRFLKETLPDFMLPSAFVTLDEIPFTHNVKIDLRALPAPGETRLATDKSYAAPRTPTEELLASIWTKVLGVERVGIDDNFFELGGHSLLATQVMSRVRETFQVELPLRHLFESPTVTELARRIEQAGTPTHESDVPELKPLSHDHSRPLSFAQQRLWFLDQLVPGSPFYNMPVAVRLRGQLDPSALEQTLSEITRRHEVLRTNFPAIDGEPVQKIRPAARQALPIINLDSLPTDQQEGEVRDYAQRQAQQPFDLSSDPLLRTSLLRLSSTEHVLLVTMHHIISDAWSMSILIREITQLYEAYARGQTSPLA
ncbi:MAG TPA: amino acid adenylation domain-containing protein, partial [Pyrinomonadaceae bacterium]